MECWVCWTFGLQQYSGFYSVANSVEILIITLFIFKYENTVTESWKLEKDTQ